MKSIIIDILIERQERASVWGKDENEIIFFVDEPHITITRLMKLVPHENGMYSIYHKGRYKYTEKRHKTLQVMIDKNYI